MAIESRGRILLAEDDPDQSEVLAELLRNEGYEVLLADSSLQVVHQLTFRPEVLLLDLNGVSSPAVFRALDALPPRPALVLVSADSRISEVAQKLGADAYLEKPYDLTELLSVVATAIEGRRIAQSAMSVSAYC